MRSEQNQLDVWVDHTTHHVRFSPERGLQTEPVNRGIGRLTMPEPTELQQIEVQPQGLVVWFNHEPKLHGEWVDGTLGLLFAAKGQPQNGQLKVNGRDVNWRVSRTDAGVMLTLVAARALKGDWAGAPQDGRWRLQVNLQE